MPFYSDLGNNRISGQIPTEIGNLLNLTRLSLTENLFSGAIPSQIGQLTALKSLELGNNQFTGSIPSNFQALLSLKNLELNDNLFTGTTPTVLGILQNLLTLSLHANSISGVIPTQLGLLRNLTFLSLAQNSINGSIPSELGKLTKLQFLYLQDNSLSYVVPTHLGQLVQLRHLFMSNNKLTGAIPNHLGDLTQLMALRAEYNSFTGIPSTLSSLTQTKRILLPNPMISIPYDLVSHNPSMTLLESDWNAYLNSSSFTKRQLISNVGNMTTDQLYALCPLNDVTNPEVPAGCIAGIYRKFCTDIATEAKLAECQSVYNRVFAASIFKPIGEVCPAWKQGPRSKECFTATSKFRYQLPYILVTSEHATNLSATIFGSKKYAPCYNVGKIACRW